MHDGNILSADRYVGGGGVFFMRLEIEGEGFGLARDEFTGAFRPLARRHGMDWYVSHTDTPKKVAILVSRHNHCLTDLLWRWDAGEFVAEIPLVVSPPGPRPARGGPRRSLHHFPVTKETKTEHESRVLDLLSENGVDIVVLAQYMQILTLRFVDAYKDGLINIHHSFLPAFAGADPYPRAHERGAKTIGATAQYVSEELDAGPIIHQDVAHVSHRDSVEDLIRQGREIERRVLARAVRLHLEDRILVDGNRTVVFE